MATDQASPDKYRVLRLYTHWHTLIYFDATSNTIRHQAIDACPVNTVLVAVGPDLLSSTQAVFVTSDHGAFTLAQFAPEDGSPSDDPEPAISFRLFFHSRDQISLVSNGLFLTAEPDGQVTLSRREPSEWERFTIALPKAAAPDLPASVLEAVDQAVLKPHTDPVPYIPAVRGAGRWAVICDIDWLSTYIASEHYHFVSQLHSRFQFDLIDGRHTDFVSGRSLQALSQYELIFITYTRDIQISINLLTTVVVTKIDDLETYNSTYQHLLRSLAQHSDMLVSPYAYAAHRYFPHPNLVWIPYSSAVEEECPGLTFNTHPLNQVLVSGSVADDRPFRSYVFSLDSPDLAKLAHPGYGNRYDNTSTETVKARWYETLNRYLCVFCDAHSLRYIHLRVFEAASVGALLLADRLVEPEMNQLGFIDGETCIFSDQSDFLDKVRWILDADNRSQVDRIRRAGMELALARHTTRRRVAEFIAVLEDHFGIRFPNPAADAAS